MGYMTPIIHHYESRRFFSVFVHYHKIAIPIYLHDSVSRNMLAICRLGTSYKPDPVGKRPQHVLNARELLTSFQVVTLAATLLRGGQTAHE